MLFLVGFNGDQKRGARKGAESLRDHPLRKMFSSWFFSWVFSRFFFDFLQIVVQIFLLDLSKILFQDVLLVLL